MTLAKPAKRKWISGEYWTMFYYGGELAICSKHKSLLAAERAMRECEKRGGAKHRLLHVQECGR